MQLVSFAAGYRRLSAVRSVTAADYLMVARSLTDFAGGSLLLDELSATLVNDYLNHLADLGRAPETLASRRRKLLVLWRAAYRERATEVRPDDERVLRIRVPDPDPQGFDRSQTERLIRYCLTAPPLRRRLRLVAVPQGDYLAALFAFLWDSAMRLGDATRFEFAQLAPTIRWRQSKTGRFAAAELRPETLALVERIRLPERPLIWPRPGRTRTALYRMLKRTIEGAGLEGTTKFIRRGAATNVYGRDEDPAITLGHAPGSRVAYRHYISRTAQLKIVSPEPLAIRPLQSRP